jgi:hypothetical protein
MAEDEDALVGAAPENNMERARAPRQWPASQDPEFYKKSKVGDAGVHGDLEDIYKAWDQLIAPGEWADVEYVVLALIRAGVQDLPAYTKVTNECRRLQRKQPKKSQILHVLLSLMQEEGRLAQEPMTVEQLETLKRVLVKKGGKSTSGVLVITVLTSPYPAVEGGRPQRFSCQWNWCVVRRLAMSLGCSLGCLRSRAFSPCACLLSGVSVLVDCALPAR